MMNHLFRRALPGLAALSLCLFSACDRTEPEPESPGRVLILNEGGFQQSTSSVTRYNPDNEAVSQDAFRQQNGYNPGDILQSAVLIDGVLYLVVNNSQRIIACDPDSLTETGRIEGFTSPRFLLGAGNGKGYVTDLFGGAVSKVNLTTLAIEKTIPLPGWTEEMIAIDGKVWIANYNAAKLYVLDPATDQIVDSVEAGSGAANLELDADGHLWVLCQGDFFTGAGPSFVEIRPSDKAELNRIQFPAGATASDLAISPDGDSLYFLMSGSLYSMPANASTLPANPAFNAGGVSFYSLGTDPVTGEIYLGDALDFSQRGRVFRLSSSFVPIDTVAAGIIPGDFLFLPE